MQKFFEYILQNKKFFTKDFELEPWEIWKDKYVFWYDKTHT